MIRIGPDRARVEVSALASRTEMRYSWFRVPECIASFVTYGCPTFVVTSRRFGADRWSAMEFRQLGPVLNIYHCKLLRRAHRQRKVFEVRACAHNAWTAIASPYRIPSRFLSLHLFCPQPSIGIMLMVLYHTFPPGPQPPYVISI